MDKIIEGIRKVLRTPGDENIADLLIGAKHKIIESSTYGSRAHSTISSVVISSIPENIALLNILSSEQKLFNLESPIQS